MSEANEVERVVNCRHNARCRYTHGFYCEDCETFFSKDSPTYRAGELLSSIWMVLNNINVDRYRNDLEPSEDVSALIEEIGIGKRHENYEDIINRAEMVIATYGKNSNSASITLDS